VLTIKQLKGRIHFSSFEEPNGYNSKALANYLCLLGGNHEDARNLSRPRKLEDSKTMMH
jgi:hypothetical protein